MRMQVMGWKHSKGEFNGNAYDYVTLYTVARLRASENQRGAAGIEMRGEPHLVEKLRKLEFNGPLPLEVTTEAMATGKGGFVEMVINVEPLKQ